MTSCQDQGYATEALRSLVAVLMARNEVQRVTAVTLADDQRGRRVLEEAGLHPSRQWTDRAGRQPVELVGYELDLPR